MSTLTKNTTRNNTILIDDIVIVDYADGTTIFGRVLQLGENTEPWILRGKDYALYYVYPFASTVKYVRLYRRSWTLSAEDKRLYGFDSSFVSAAS